MEIQKQSLIVLIDFDGTCVTHEFPKVGRDIGAVPVLKKIIAAGHQLVLFTMRDDVIDPTSDSPEIITVSGEYLTHAVEWFESNDIPLYGIQSNPTQKTWTGSPKAYGHLIIDDTSLGIPMIYPEKGRPYVDWHGVEVLLILRNII